VAEFGDTEDGRLPNGVEENVQVFRGSPVLFRACQGRKKGRKEGWQIWGDTSWGGLLLRWFWWYLLHLFIHLSSFSLPACLPSCPPFLRFSFFPALRLSFLPSFPSSSYLMPGDLEWDEAAKTMKVGMKYLV
jgi:hypothetical protein